MTPLHVAMKQTSAGYPIEHVVETLLRRQPPAFNVNSRDVDDQSPLHYAAVYCNDHPHVIKLLLDRYNVEQVIMLLYILLLYNCPNYAVVQDLTFRTKKVLHL